MAQKLGESFIKLQSPWDTSLITSFSLKLSSELNPLGFCAMRHLQRGIPVILKTIWVARAAVLRMHLEKDSSAMCLKMKEASLTMSLQKPRGTETTGKEFSSATHQQTTLSLAEMDRLQ